jgi:hypothetical protein
VIHIYQPKLLKKKKKRRRKKVKERSVQQAQFLSSSHRVVLPWCAQALAAIEFTGENVNCQTFNVSFAGHHFLRNSLWQKCGGSKNQSYFSTCERFSTLCHTFQS